ncbi:MAG: DUF6452 family protein [Flavobacterium sp.]|uniref:DUF6452 family protein n=1 Tax=Flavobacterium sp. TaxID=239 RepID=UPI0027362154|nr:DUF6452 family protein [Flavobacterium sp.]MDP3681595.1 DUF6452 family protein [Flavobacterium sp.]MDZ4330505.1 DUF6452 family protein [Flavobacterium sp.]
MKKIILLVFALALSFSSCEKDDICDANTPTTPRLVISFYDFLNPSVLKNVTNLKVVGEGMTEGIVFNTATGDAKYLTNGSTISIPLKTVGTSTSYSFTLNSGNTNPALVNVDNIKFDYTTQELFVSRACGYKTIFTLDPINPYTHTDAEVADEKWIEYISVEKSNLENENETHIKIFF